MCKKVLFQKKIKNHNICIYFSVFILLKLGMTLFRMSYRVCFFFVFFFCLIPSVWHTFYCHTSHVERIWHALKPRHDNPKDCHTEFFHKPLATVKSRYDNTSNCHTEISKPPMTFNRIVILITSSSPPLIYIQPYTHTKAIVILRVFSSFLCKNLLVSWFSSSNRLLVTH